MFAVVQQELCTGCELCPSIAPEIFQMGTDGKAHPIVDEIAAQREPMARDAEQRCPVNAITLVKKKFEQV